MFFPYEKGFEAPKLPLGETYLKRVFLPKI